MAATGQIAAIAADGGDPRMSQTVIRDEAGPNAPVSRLLHDPSVTFEEYVYYAERTRAEEAEAARTEEPSTGILQVIFPTKSGAGVKPISSSLEGSESNSQTNGDEKKEAPEATPHRSRRIVITDTEWTNASRAVRTASGAACFYLITTDILGPFGIGYVTIHSSSNDILILADTQWEPWVGDQGSRSLRSSASWQDSKWQTV